MTNLTHAKQPQTPPQSLSKQISWLPENVKKFPKSLNSSLTIGLIASDRVYWSMQFEAKVLAITEKNWKWVLKYGGIDLLLIESSAETATGDWFMAQTAPDIASTAFADMVSTARTTCIPVAYWFTLDEAYFSQYENIINWMENVFCADPRVVEVLGRQDKVATLLPPAVQPALFTKLNEYSAEKQALNRLVCDDLVGVIQGWDARKEYLRELQQFGARFFDSRNQIWEVKTKKLDLSSDSLLGTVDFKSRVELFRKSRTLGILKSESRTRTDMQWSIVEAAASHMTILREAGVDAGEFTTLCLQPRNQDQFFVELIRHDKDNLYHERISQKSWRETLSYHTFSHRLRSICEHLKIDHDWVEYPSAAMITPSYRSKFLDRAAESFSRQSYRNKYWVMVFNGPYSEYPVVKDKVQEIENSKAIYVPEELHAGPCMNSGIQATTAEYVFRMDDDDWYGDNYLLDMILYSRAVSYDVIGKVFTYWSSSDAFPNSVFYRRGNNFEFNKPAIIMGGQSPTKFSFLAGCSQGMRREFNVMNPYPAKNFSTVDSQWLDYLRAKGEGIMVSCDSLNLLVDRRLSGDHTWHTNIDSFEKNSRRFDLPAEKVSFV